MIFDNKQQISSDSSKSDIQSLKKDIKGMSFAALQQLDHRQFDSGIRPKSSSDESKIGSKDSKNIPLPTVKESNEALEPIEEEKKAEPLIENIQMIHQFENHIPEVPQAKRFQRIETHNKKFRDKRQKDFFDKQRRDIKKVKDTEKKIYNLSNVNNTDLQDRLSHQIQLRIKNVARI